MRRGKCETVGHAWAPYTSTRDYRITEICVRGKCPARVVRDMTDAEKDEFDAELEAMEGWDN